MSDRSRASRVKAVSRASRKDATAGALDGEALRASEARFRRIVEVASEGIWEVDAEDRTTFVNPKMAEMLGTTVAEMLGVPVWAFVDDEWQRVGAACMERRRQGEDERIEFKLCRADGAELWTIVAANALTDADGKYAGTLALVTDITDRKHAEAERERLLAREQAALAELHATQQQVSQQERLRALGQMASGIAHDFNNALSPVIAYSELLLDQPEKLADRDRTLRFVELIYNAGQDAAGVVRRLRDFYRQRDMDDVVEPVHLDQLIAQVVSFTQFKWKDQAQAEGRTIVIRTDLRQLPTVSGNPAELREALANLILNAVDAMPKGGTIGISGQTRGEQVALAVRDSGVGMTEEVRLHCLEPFYTTKGEHGSGLGLGMVYGIVQRHHGTLDIESAPGAGTTVRLCLPIWQDCAPEDADLMAVLELPTLSVLVVEDEPAIRAALAEYLTADGHTVETAPDGRAGLALFRPGRFDLVLTDRALPEINGDQLAAEIKRREPGLPIVMVTGFGDLMRHRGECPDGVDLILTKPITLRALRAGIGQVLGIAGTHLTRRAFGAAR